MNATFFYGGLVCGQVAASFVALLCMLCWRFTVGNEAGRAFTQHEFVILKALFPLCAVLLICSALSLPLDIFPAVLFVGNVLRYFALLYLTYVMTIFAQYGHLLKQTADMRRVNTDEAALTVTQNDLKVELRQDEQQSAELQFNETGRLQSLSITRRSMHAKCVPLMWFVAVLTIVGEVAVVISAGTMPPGSVDRVVALELLAEGVLVVESVFAVVEACRARTAPTPRP